MRLILVVLFASTMQACLYTAPIVHEHVTVPEKCVGLIVKENASEEWMQYQVHQDKTRLVEMLKRSGLFSYVVDDRKLINTSSQKQFVINVGYVDYYLNEPLTLVISLWIIPYPFTQNRGFNLQIQEADSSQVVEIDTVYQDTYWAGLVMPLFSFMKEKTSSYKKSEELHKQKELKEILGEFSRAGMFAGCNNI